MPLIQAGDWKTASSNIVAETLKLDSVEVQTKVAEIFQQLIKDYQGEVEQEKEVTVDKEIIVEETKGTKTSSIDIKVDVTGPSLKTPVSVTKKTVTITTEPEEVDVKKVKETKEVTVSTKDLVGGVEKVVTKVETGVKPCVSESESKKMTVTK